MTNFDGGKSRCVPCRLIAAAALLAAAAVGVCRYRALSAESLAERQAFLAEVVGLKARILSVWWEQRREWTQRLAQTPPLASALADAAAGDRAAIRRSREELSAIVSRGNCAWIAVESPDGREFLAVGSKGAPSEGAEFAQPLTGRGGGQVRAYVRFSPSFMDLITFVPTTDAGSRLTLLDREGRTLSGPGGDGAAAMKGVHSLPYSRERGWQGEARTVPGLGWRVVIQDDAAQALQLARYEAWVAAGAAGALGLLLAGGMNWWTRKGEKATCDTYSLLAQAIDQASESVVITDAAARIQYVNPAFCRLTGYSREEAVGATPRVLRSGRHDKRFYEEMWSTLLRGETWRGRLVNRKRDGTLFEEEGSIAPVRGEDGAVTHYIAVKRDVGAEAALEQQLRQAQKMEAVGSLAGGVAHDFNNILTTIIGNADLALRDPACAPAAGELRQIVKAGRFAAELTRQLLLFSRRQRSEPVTLDACAAASGLEKLLRRSLGPKVSLAIETAPPPVWTSMDPTQFDQVLLNLVVNARDALPEGGRIDVAVRPVELLAPLAHPHGRVPAGQYAAVSVTDGGMGMGPEVLRRLFEPFFTTKEKGRGTGLGLATVFGIVKDARGHIAVRSAPRMGSTFTVYLPLVPPPARSAPETQDEAPRQAAGETILLAEDQEEVRSVAERALRAEGYTVLTCHGGQEALKVEAGHRGEIHLLLSDVMMPGMDGRELADALSSRRPGLRVLLMSGYSEERPGETPRARAGEDMLPKPFTVTALLERVHAALRRPAAVAPRERI